MAENRTNEVDHQNEKPDIKGDRLNLILLISLYILQSALMGMTEAISFVLQKRKVSYQDQAEFSIADYPFAFKILWAPIIDTIYSKKMGRRKTWLIPTQYLIGTLLLLISLNVDSWLGSEDGAKNPPNIRLLTIVFFVCIFLASMQDIAVDGWSLTILQRKNIGYASICNSVGFSLGNFLAFPTFIALNSKDFCNKFRSIPQDHGFITFSGFTCFWGMMFIIVTTIVLIFKRESSAESEQQTFRSLNNSYVLLWNILKIRKIQSVSLFMLAILIFLHPTTTVGPLKLLDAGVPQDIFALLAAPATPILLILPFLLSRFLTGPRPMRIFFVFYILKLINNVLYALFVYLLSQSKSERNTLPAWYPWPLFIIYNFNRMTTFIMGTALQGFCARISDPRFGGIYMTLFFCMINFGWSSISTISLWLVDPLTVKSCKTGGMEKSEACYTIVDGFYIETAACVFLGLLWWIWGKKLVHKLEKLESSSYAVQLRQPNQISTIEEQLQKPITDTSSTHEREICS